MKKQIKLSEDRLASILKEAIEEVTRTPQNISDNVRNAIYNTATKCRNIILQTEYAGRSFDLLGKDKELEADQTYMQLKNDLIKNMEGYFYSTKTLLEYLVDKSGDEQIARDSHRALKATFNPTWN